MNPLNEAPNSFAVNSMIHLDTLIAAATCSMLHAVSIVPPPLPSRRGSFTRTQEGCATMPRRARQPPGGSIYHALKRTMARLERFRQAADYGAFLWAFDEPLEPHALRILGHRILPMHWQVLLRPAADGKLR